MAPLSQAFTEFLAPVDHLCTEPHHQEQWFGITITKGVVAQRNTVGDDLGHVVHPGLRRMTGRIVTNALSRCKAAQYSCGRNSQQSGLSMQAGFPSAQRIHTNGVELEVFTAGSGRPLGALPRLA